MTRHGSRAGPAAGSGGAALHADAAVAYTARLAYPGEQAMAQWFFNYNGEQIGPLDDAQALEQARRNRNGHCWRQGFAEWQPIAQVEELRDTSPAPVTAAAPPAVSAPAAAAVARKPGQRASD